MATKIEIKQDYRYPLRVRQVLAVVFICSLTIFILMSVCLISSYWITSDGFRQGLLYLCIEEQDPQSRGRYESLPFDLNKEELEPGCYPNRDVGKSTVTRDNLQQLNSSRVSNSCFQINYLGYLKVCTFFCLITQLSAMASACLTGLGMRLRGLKRTSCLRFAICTTLVSFICDTALLVIYPTQFAKEIDRSNRDLWELNGAFGLACGAAILAFGALLLLIITLRRTSNPMYEAAPTRI